MKKIFISLIILIFTIIVSTALLLKIYESRIIEGFKKQIIDKTEINFNFSKINLSLLKNFPYCSIILDDVYIYYSNDKNPETLLFSKNVSFKINTINLFQGIFEFPEIAISDGYVNIDGDKIGELFSNETVDEPENSFSIKTEKIKLKRTRVTYSLGKSLKLNFFIRNAISSGSYNSNAFKLGLNISVDSLVGYSNNFRFKEDEAFKISALLLEKDKLFFIEEGSIKNNFVNLQFALKYSLRSDILQTTLSSISPIDFRKLKSAMYSKVKENFAQGSISFTSFYSVNFNDINTQKLSVTYNVQNAKLISQKDLTIKEIKGTSTLYGNFEKNNTDLNRFYLTYSGLEFTGSAKIKGFPKPVVLLNVKLSNPNNFELSEENKVTGKIDGDIKLLVKVDDINNIDYKHINIIDIKSKLNLSTVSISSTKSINSLTGSLSLFENKVLFSGKGSIYTSPFNGTIEIDDYLKEYLSDKPASPNISISLDRLNIDSLLAFSTSGASKEKQFDYNLIGKIGKAFYKGTEMSDLAFTIEYSNDKYSCHHFSTDVFDGKLAGNFSYSERDGVNTSLLFQKIDVKKLFKTYKNFDQSIVTYESINGNLSGKTDILYHFDRNGNVNPKSVKATAQLVLENGSFTDLSQFTKMSKFLNLKEIETIQFKTLENTITVEKELVTIPSMKISSNALNLQLAGQHGFNGEFTYWIKVNLKEILAKKFKKNNQHITDYESDSNSGLNLFIKFTGNSDSYKFSFDKKNSLSKIKSELNSEKVNLKNIIKEEFSSFIKDTSSFSDSTRKKLLNKNDSLHNKSKKKPFKIEWDEIDTTKKF